MLLKLFTLFIVFVFVLKLYNPWLVGVTGGGIVVFLGEGTWTESFWDCDCGGPLRTTFGFWTTGTGGFYYKKPKNSSAAASRLLPWVLGSWNLGCDYFIVGCGCCCDIPEFVKNPFP